ncbi:MAG: protein kinase [Deltaproteobacteria bacterium]|nr:protein kinase [Deltaproteobacteria bacterium]
MTEDNKARLQNILGDKYDVQKMIYRGGMGEIYLGTHRQLNAKVAIKIMIQKLTDDPELKKRFHREAQLYANLRHPNIIHIYDFGTEEIFDYMVFPFIDGENLQEKLKTEVRLDEAECLNIIISVAKALAYASENNVIHRDVKPSNIMIENNGNVLIADFGISKDLKDIDITLPGTVLGSPKYMSPEQILGDHVDSTSDQYSLGLIFYEMMAGEFPFKGTTPSALFYSHVNENPDWSSENAARVNPAFRQIINKLIAKAPADRYENFNALIEDLTRIQLEQTQISHGLMPSGSGGRRTVLTRYAILAVAIAVILIVEYFGINLYMSSPKGTAKPGKAIVQTAPPLPTAQADAVQKDDTKQPEKVAASAAPLPLPPPGEEETFIASIASIKDILFNFGQADTTALYQIRISGSNFRIGERIVYTIESRKDCYVTLLDFTTGGELIQLFPNGFNRDSHIMANTTYNIPSQGSFEVTGPWGSETVIGFASESPFDLTGSSFGDSPFLSLNDKDTAALKRIYNNIQMLKKRRLIRKNIDFRILSQ